MLFSDMLNIKNNFFKAKSAKRYEHKHKLRSNNGDGYVLVFTCCFYNNVHIRGHRPW